MSRGSSKSSSKPLLVEGWRGAQGARPASRHYRSRLRPHLVSARSARGAPHPSPDKPDSESSQRAPSRKTPVSSLMAEASLSTTPRNLSSLTTPMSLSNSSSLTTPSNTSIRRSTSWSAITFISYSCRTTVCTSSSLTRSTTSSRVSRTTRIWCQFFSR